MPFWIHMLMGLAVGLLTIYTETAIPIFLGYCFFIFLLFVWPAAAGWFFIAAIALAVLWVLSYVWEAVAGVVLGIVMFMFLILGLMAASARAEDYKENMPYDVCVEAGSDILEVEYAHWPVVKQVNGPMFDQTIKARGNQQVEVTCTKNELIIRKGPRQVQLQMEVTPAK